jgi:undecaprenyl-diphosphatase
MSATCNGVIDTGFVHLGYAKVAFLGLVQGITELLPISSTAHMRVVPALLGWEDPGSAFSAAMQLAALVGVVSYFWKDIAGLATGSIGAAVKGDFRNRDLLMVGYIVLGTIPIAIAGLALTKVLNACNSPLRGVAVIGAACLVMAALLALAEITAKHRRTMEQATLLDAVLIGLAQALTLIPGVSRSGSTLTAALGLGFKREEAARFSFLLGIPAIALAGLKEIAELHKAHLDGHGWSILAVGLVVGAISSIAAIWGLMRFLERFSTWPFVIYRAALGVLLLAGAAYGFIH